MKKVLSILTVLAVFSACNTSSVTESSDLITTDTVIEDFSSIDTVENIVLDTIVNDSI